MNQRSSITGYACLSRNGHAAILFRRTTAGDDVMPRCRLLRPLPAQAASAAYGGLGGCFIKYEGYESM